MPRAGHAHMVDSMQVRGQAHRVNFSQQTWTAHQASAPQQAQLILAWNLGVKD